MKTTAVPQTLQPANTGPSPNYAAEKVAKDFEALFANYLVRSMRKTVPDGGLVPKSMGEKIYTELLDNEYASQMAKSGTLGLSDLILKELEKHGEYTANAQLESPSIQPWMMDNRFVPTQTRQAFTQSGSIEERLAPYQHIIEKAAGKYGLDSDLVTAVIAQESAGNQYAVSRAGAKGLMQLMDSTAKDMGVRQVYNALDNVMGGTKYLKTMLDRFNGNEKLALASYNAGPGAVERYDGIPPYRETQEYVEKVLEMRQRLAEQETRASKED